jgi:hypothetical protein
MGKYAERVRVSRAARSGRDWPRAPLGASRKSYKTNGVVPPKGRYFEICRSIDKRAGSAMIATLVARY